MSTTSFPVEHRNGYPSGAMSHPSYGKLPSFAILSTFPPTQCGLATFAAALAGGLQEVGVEALGIVNVSEGSAVTSDPRVVAHLSPQSTREQLHAARLINSYDYLLIQHEFGIFGGTDGDEVLSLLDDVYVPVIVTLHTVPLVPSVGQRRVLEALARRADVLIVMSHSARERFVHGYDIDVDKIVTIPHGATVPPFIPLKTNGPISLLTWGLLGPGKGMEWVIDALAMTPELRGQVTYTIAGQTHPKVFLREGEKYRNMLKRRAELLGVADMVFFDDEYRSLSSLMELIQNSHCVVLPYDSHDQVTSGVLVDAVVAGRPVIATQFPHAVELLSQGVGITVPHGDAVALAHAIRKVVTDPLALSSMVSATFPIAEEHSWVSVASRYAAIALEISAKNLV
jgi:polysaccharide biosynthesis protein PslF